MLAPGRPTTAQEAGHRHRHNDASGLALFNGLAVVFAAEQCK